MKTNRETKDYLAEVIKLAAQLDLEKEDVEPILTDENLVRMGIPLPPDDMFERIMKQLKIDNENELKTSPSFCTINRWF